MRCCAKAAMAECKAVFREAGSKPGMREFSRLWTFEAEELLQLQEAVG